MTHVMAQQSHGLSVPSSRRDVISALLHDYGTSFGRGDGSSALSPVPAEKDLPRPPPSDILRNKPLPAVQRAEQRMSTKFQLRVIEDAPLSPSVPPKDPSTPRTRKRIQYRSLSREAKPPSLNLIVSNGSTAILPITPVPPARSKTFPGSSNTELKDLPSPPPPPPEKSTRRSEVQQKAAELKQSNSQTDLVRNDSLLSNGETYTVMDRPGTVEARPPVKRKALPETAAKKFVGLAQLGTGPRGGKGGPLLPPPPPSAPRSKSIDNEASLKANDDVVKSQDEQTIHAPSIHQMPPTPEEDKLPIPAPPRKAALGLPSNPRARGAPVVSPQHVHGKNSSTGFGLLKAARPAPPIPTKIVETLTPQMTPSPTLKPEQLKNQAVSPLSPLPPPKEQTRPYSFEPMLAPAPPPKLAEQPKSAVPIVTPPRPRTQSLSPGRPSSADLSDAGPSFSPANLSPAAPATQEAPESPVSPLVPEAAAQPPSVAGPRPMMTQEASTPPLFAPLTRAPIPVPQTLIPSITPVHLSCYTSHKNNIWSNNMFQPMGCMICHEIDRERNWCCTWCQLRICMTCSDELCTIPGRNLQRYLAERETRQRQSP
ncbi:hypothetical protein ACEQ8H_004380 [Pleosporales sp. CAS-2024a]